MRVFVTGATGFIGGHIVRALQARGDDVVALSRNSTPAHLPSSVRLVDGDPTKPGRWMDEAHACDAAINLAGEPLAGVRWTAARKKRLMDSRVLTTRNLVRALAPAAALISTSAVGYYGTHGDELLDESSPAGDDYLAAICKAWESEAQAASGRSVQIRVGLALGRDGGALAKMITPFKLFAGGPLGSGRQWTSFVHIDDLVGLYLFALDDARVSGPLNGTAPEPCTMRQLTSALGHALRRPSWLPVPGPALKLAFGESSTVLLDGQRVVPARALALGFHFRFPAIGPALDDLFAVGSKDVSAHAE